jgi:uncharacterized membrane protein YdjX (TVP38/TMEM64 family)
MKVTSSLLLLTTLLKNSLVAKSWALSTGDCRYRSTKYIQRQRVSTVPCFAARSHLAESENNKKRRLFPKIPISNESDLIDDQVKFLKDGKKSVSVSTENGVMNPTLVGAGSIAAFLAIFGGIAVANNIDVSATDLLDSAERFFNDPSVALENVVQSVEAMGSLGPLYFGAAYTAAEILAIPAIPLTASAGYLFGVGEGTAVVLFSASIAATISFVIGRTLLRSYVESVLDDYPKFAKIDRAIGKEGFKLMLLLRVSPIFPFALSNYLYGASSINFSSFFWGTLLGFTPGTLAIVYAGYVGKALTTEGSESYPWFVYVGGLALFTCLLKVLADTATRIVEEMEGEEGNI